MPLPRPEYPRPILVRERWLNLNGPWQFAFDFGKSGEQAGWPSDRSTFDQTIIVPFCPESRLSGIGNTDFMRVVWYHRRFEVPASWSGRRVLLHFGAVDYETAIWINGAYAGSHTGGFVPFSLDIEAFVFKVAKLVGDDDRTVVWVHKPIQ